MREREIEAIDKLYENTNEPLTNILMFARIGVEHSRDLITDGDRIAMDNRLIKEIKKARKRALGELK